MRRVEIHNRIVAIIDQVTGAGINVYPRKPVTVSWSKILPLFRTPDETFNAWMVRRTMRLDQHPVSRKREAAHIFEISGIMQVNEELDTETIFQTQVDEVVNGFGDETLGLTGGISTHCDWGPMKGTAGLQLERFEERIFGGVLCHYAQCRICVIEL